jgi:UDP-N-acetylmuramate--alanine ligase
MSVMSSAYADAFGDADVVVITDIYSSGTTPIPGVTGKLVVDAIENSHPGKKVEWIAQREDLVSFLASTLTNGDLCISMGCGDVAQLPDEVILLRQSNRANKARS